MLNLYIRGVTGRFMSLKTVLTALLLLQFAVAFDLSVGLASNNKNELLVFSCQDNSCRQTNAIELGRAVNSQWMGDLDNDGVQELVIVTDSRVDEPELVVYECNGECLVQSSAEIGYNTMSLDVGDVDGDGDKEIVVGTELSTSSQEVIVYDCGGGECVVENTIDRNQNVNDIAVGDVDGDGVNEIVLGMDKRSGSFELVVYDCLDQCRIDDAILLLANVESVAIGDLAGTKMVAVTDQKIDAPEMIVFDCSQEKCSQVATSELSFGVNEVAISDLDGDGKNEVMVGLKNHVSKDELLIFTCDRTCELKSSFDVGSDLDAVAVGLDGVVFIGRKFNLDGPEVYGVDCADECRQAYEIETGGMVLSLSIGFLAEAEGASEVEKEETVPEAVPEPETPVDDEPAEDVPQETTVETETQEPEVDEKVSVKQDVSYDITGSVIAIVVLAGLLAFVLPKLKKQ